MAPQTPDPEQAKAFRIWLTSMPPDTPLSVLVRHATSRWEFETDYKDMNQHLGLGHYEGRTWAGFHHHATLVSAAHLLCLEQRLNLKPWPRSDTPAGRGRPRKNPFFDS